jgi:hypothetical protein
VQKAISDVELYLLTHASDASALEMLENAKVANNALEKLNADPNACLTEDLDILLRNSPRMVPMLIRLVLIDG